MALPKERFWLLDWRFWVVFVPGVLIALVFVNAVGWQESGWRFLIFFMSGMIIKMIHDAWLAERRRKHIREYYLKAHPPVTDVHHAFPEDDGR